MTTIFNRNMTIHSKVLRKFKTPEQYVIIHKSIQSINTTVNTQNTIKITKLYTSHNYKITQQVIMNTVVNTIDVTTRSHSR